MSATDLTITPMQALEEKKGWATSLAGSSLLPPSYRKQPANLLLAAEYADTLGVPRIAALTGIHIIQGKPTMSADLMLALVRRAGHRVRVEGDDTRAHATLLRADDPDFTYATTWTMEKARTAGLLAKSGSAWETYPAAMLRARAITEVVRMGASEVLFGAIYAPEELGVPVDETGNPVEHADTPPATHGSHSHQHGDAEPSRHHGAPDDAPSAPLASQELLDEIHAYSVELRLSRDQLAKTAMYCGHDGSPVPTLEVGLAMAEYLKDRRDQELADSAAQSLIEDAQEIVDVETVDGEGES